MNNPHPIGIAINVMRARLTLVGFNIAIVSFQLSEMFNLAGGIPIPGLSKAIHFRADMALFLALALSLLSLVAFISSSALDDQGTCDHRIFIVGELLMYLGLAHTATGFFSPLNATFLVVGQHLPDQFEQIALFREAVFYMGSLVWVAAIYIGPTIALIRAPFSKKMTLKLSLVYVASLVLMFWFSHQVTLFEAVNTTKVPLKTPHFWQELLQPMLW